MATKNFDRIIHDLAMRLQGECKKQFNVDNIEDLSSFQSFCSKIIKADWLSEALMDVATHEVGAQDPSRVVTSVLDYFAAHSDVLFRLSNGKPMDLSRFLAKQVSFKSRDHRRVRYRCALPWGLLGDSLRSPTPEPLAIVEQRETFQRIDELISKCASDISKAAKRYSEVDWKKLFIDRWHGTRLRELAQTYKIPIAVISRNTRMIRDCVRKKYLQKEEP